VNKGSGGKVAALVAGTFAGILGGTVVYLGSGARLLAGAWND
jgi:hypothetical protein